MRRISLICSLWACAAVLSLSACGGGGDSYRSEITKGNSTWVCNSESADKACLAGSCSQCSCTKGACQSTPTTAKAKLSVNVMPTTWSLAATPEVDVMLTLSNPASTAQTVSFTLNWPAGAITLLGAGFSAPCTPSAGALSTYSGNNIQALIEIPSASSCTLAARKVFPLGLNQTLSLSNLSGVELTGTLPVLNVSN